MTGRSPAPSRYLLRREREATGETMRSAVSEDGATEIVALTGSVMHE